MSLDDRITWLLIGCALGLVLGYWTRYLQETRQSLKGNKEELDEVDDIVTSIHNTEKRSERGFGSTELAVKIALPIVVLITAWAAFQAQVALNHYKVQQAQIKMTQDETAAQTVCTRTILSQTISALNIRTQYTQNQAQANVELQRAQAQLLRILLHKPPYSEEAREDASTDYAWSLGDFLTSASTTSDSFDENPYPKDDALAICIRNQLKEE